MTLEETIKYYEEKAQELKDKANHIENLTHDETWEYYLKETWEYYLKSTEEHKQLAEWLKELKSRREKDEWLDIDDYEYI